MPSVDSWSKNGLLSADNPGAHGRSAGHLLCSLCYPFNMVAEWAEGSCQLMGGLNSQEHGKLHVDMSSVQQGAACRGQSFLEVDARPMFCSLHK